MRNLFFTTLVILISNASAQAANEFTLLLELGGVKIEGTPLTWSKAEVVLLARGGRMWFIEPDQVSNYRKVSSSFAPYSASQMRSRLLRELGNQFEISTTRHYVVAHRRGERDLWASRFEELYRSFVHYFAVRKFRLHEPQFPLVAVICRDRSEMFRFAQREGSQVRSDAPGYYSPRTNRVWLYDLTKQYPNVPWYENASLVIHEATHQTAFNTGIHTRMADPPQWLVEGLATMFEARGVWDSRRYPSQRDRINRRELDDFRAYAKSRMRPGTLAQMLSHDRLFRTDVAGAYASAWALTFYLVETQPQRYAKFVRLTAARPRFKTYTASQRMADFSAVFGKDLKLVEARWLKYIKTLR